MNMRTLQLVSPHMKGPDVLAAQKLLRDKGYNPGKLDSEFGPFTAEAAKQAKWDLGYPEKEIKPTFGDKLKNLLEGQEAPLAYRIRAKSRKKELLVQSNKVNDVLKCALSQVGTKESPSGSNKQKYGVWYGLNGEPWCAMFISWCVEFLCGHSRRFKFHYAYVPSVVSDARSNKGNLNIAYGPATSDENLIVACFDWQKDNTADHIGITIGDSIFKKLAPVLHSQSISEWGTPKFNKGEFWSIEGNTSPTNNSNGGAVMIRRRVRKDVQAFVRVDL